MSLHRPLAKAPTPMADSQLKLPDAELTVPECVSFQYGAGQLAATYCGLPTPRSPFPDYWIHGWNIPHTLVSPLFTAGGRPHRMVWTGTQIAADFLTNHGVKALAIGLPICYLPKKTYQRIPNSLVVMPAHSEQHTRHQWKFQEYAEQIHAIRQEFSRVVVCIHPACIEKGYWINEFTSLNFETITGADYRDKNALERIRSICSQFEYITTNSCGSQIAYGAAFGAKPSIFGTYAEYQEDDFSGKSFFQRHPQILSAIVSVFSESAVREAYPDLFSHPKAAVKRKEWGEEQIGVANVRTPYQLIRDFRWTRRQQAILKLRKFCSVGTRVLRSTVAARRKRLPREGATE